MFFDSNFRLMTLDKHAIQREGIREAVIEIKVEVEGINLRSSFGHRFASAHFSFTCKSEIKTDEKSYVGQMQGEEEWGFGWYYEKLYGTLPDVWPSAPC